MAQLLHVVGLAGLEPRYIVMAYRGGSTRSGAGTGRQGRGALRQMSGDFRTEFVREPAVLKHHPALVLNADYRPLSYYPLSLWPWQEAVKAAWLDRVDIVAEYDQVVRSPSTAFRLPSVVVLKDYVKPQTAQRREIAAAGRASPAQAAPCTGGRRTAQHGPEISAEPPA